MKKLIYILLLSAFSTLLFAGTTSLVEYPIVFEIDGEIQPAKKDKASLRLKSGEEKRAEITAILEKIVTAANSGDSAKLQDLLTSPKDAKRATKFIKMFRISDAKNIELAPIAKDKGMYIAPFKPSAKKFRRGMNIFVFAELDGKLKWNVSNSAPVFALLADSAAFAPKASSREALVGESEILPAFYASGRAVRNADAEDGVESLPAAKFYHTAQEDFFACNLEKYAKAMTDKSAKKFAEQYLSMSKDAQRKALADYFSWKKKYLKLLDCGDVCILIFSREKDGQKQIDTTYIIRDGKSYKVANFSAQKSPFDRFLERCIIK